MRTLTHAMVSLVVLAVVACGSPDAEPTRGGAGGQAAAPSADTLARGAQDPATDPATDPAADPTADPHAGHQPAGEAAGEASSDAHTAHDAAQAQAGAAADHTGHAAAPARPGAAVDHTGHAAAPAQPGAGADHAAHTAAAGRPAAAADHAAHAATPAREAAGEHAGHAAQETAAGGMVGGMTKLLELVNLLLEDDDVRTHVRQTPELNELHAAATAAHGAAPPGAAAHDAHSPDTRAPAAQTPGTQQHTAHAAQAPGAQQATRGSTAEDSAAVAETVRRFHAALQSGDSATALGLLTQDVIVQESGSVETRDEYRSHHLPADIAFARAVPRETGPIRVTVRGDVAWSTSTSIARGTFRDREVNSQTAELMVLVRTAAGWRISAIHWSSRTLRN